MIVAFEVLNLAFEAPITPAGKKSVLVAMADYASKDGTGVWPSAKRLARKTGLTERWVREVRRQLRDEDGLIIMTNPPTPTRPAEYRIDLDALQLLIGRAEAGSPPELTSAPPIGSQFRPPLNGVPLPPEPNAPKPPVEPSIEPPREEVDAKLDAEVERIVAEKRQKGERIKDVAAFEAGVRRNIAPDVVKEVSAELARAARQQDIDECSMCNGYGIVAWDREVGTPQADRCTHHPPDYEGMDLFTHGESRSAFVSSNQG